MSTTSLIVVGTGIYAGHLNQESRGWISIADKVLYCVTDPTAERLINTLNKNCESLHCYYGEDKVRSETYFDMTRRTMECLKEGGLICVVYYGHPGFFVNPAHASIEAAKAAGFPAKLLPAVSSLDCLFCDLGVDAASGLQVFEATDFVLRRRVLDIYSNIVILQVSSLGERMYSHSGWKGRYSMQLKKEILRYFPPTHKVMFYTAPQYALCDPSIIEVSVDDIDDPKLGSQTTLYIPPIERAPLHISAVKELHYDHLLKEVDWVPVGGFGEEA